MKAKTVWKIPWKSRHMDAVSRNVLRPQHGLDSDLLGVRPFTLRTRPNRRDRKGSAKRTRQTQRKGKDRATEGQGT
jgi:hypothetical protein